MAIWGHTATKVPAALPSSPPTRSPPAAAAGAPARRRRPQRSTPAPRRVPPAGTKPGKSAEPLRGPTFRDDSCLPTHTQYTPPRQEADGVRTGWLTCYCWRASQARGWHGSYLARHGQPVVLVARRCPWLLRGNAQCARLPNAPDQGGGDVHDVYRHAVHGPAQPTEGRYGNP